ncbi:hypothetical protein RQP46_010710 [Phenoliferia psychrophenolica]
MSDTESDPTVFSENGVTLPGSDLTIISKDGIKFHVHKMNLAVHSAPFRDMVELGSTGQSEVNLTEDRHLANIGNVKLNLYPDLHFVILATLTASWVSDELVCHNWMLHIVSEFADEDDQNILDRLRRFEEFEEGDPTPDYILVIKAGLTNIDRLANVILLSNEGLVESGWVGSRGRR